MAEPKLAPAEYKPWVNQILKNLRKDRDRQILAKRFGFDLAKRQTLETIGQSCGITRERVRQIEKAAIQKLKGVASEEIKQASIVLQNYLEQEGGICTLATLAEKFGAKTAGERAYILFLATLAPDIELVEENDHLRTSVAIKAQFNKTKLHQLSAQLVEAVKQIGKPASLAQINQRLPQKYPTATLRNLAQVTKALASLDAKWGLATWPEVNPRSIRDKTYVVMHKHQKPLHFSEIANHIGSLEVKQRSVTVQAVHNELIKDPRFVLIGRGIYALAEWGYAPGTVADIIVDILKQEAPLHKDEIVKRVLTKRQVKTATIVLNLQEKPQFVRVAKATYKLDSQ